MPSRPAAVPAFLSLLLTASSALAEQAPIANLQPVSEAFHADAEVDPTAYVFGGYSVHVGLGYRNLRLDVGAFAMDLPEFVHGNDGFDASMNGFGLKLHYFPFAEQRGAFVGVDAGLVRILVRREGTSLASQQTQLSTGVHAGYRFLLPANLYVTPWIGVSRGFNVRDVTLGDATFDSNPLSVFPAVHLGYRFR